MKLAMATRPGGKEAGIPAAAVWSQAAVHMLYLHTQRRAVGRDELVSRSQIWANKYFLLKWMNKIIQHILSQEVWGVNAGLKKPLEVSANVSLPSFTHPCTLPSPSIFCSGKIGKILWDFFSLVNIMKIMVISVFSKFYPCLLIIALRYSYYWTEFAFHHPAFQPGSFLLSLSLFPSIIFPSLSLSFLPFYLSPRTKTPRPIIGCVPN